MMCIHDHDLCNLFIRFEFIRSAPSVSVAEVGSPNTRYMRQWVRRTLDEAGL